jgi:tRNA(His) 5'-end guanylyltransferase
MDFNQASKVGEVSNRSNPTDNTNPLLEDQEMDLPISTGVKTMVLFVSKQQASQFLTLSGETMRRYRVQGEWIEGVHWVRVNCRCVRYNLDLLEDWLHNRSNPSAHQRAIAAYQASLLSHQKTVKNRSSQNRA